MRLKSIVKNSLPPWAVTYIRKLFVGGAVSESPNQHIDLARLDDFITSRGLEPSQARVHASIMSLHLSGDPLYQHNVNYDCFADKRANCLTKLTYYQAERICESFIAAKRDQASKHSGYSPSNEWLPIYSSCMDRLVKSLYQKRIEDVIDILSNLWRQPCSTGLIGCPFSMEKLFSEKSDTQLVNKSWEFRYYLNDAVYRTRLYEALLEGAFQVERLLCNDFGNPYGIEIDGHFVKSGSEYLLYYADRIASYRPKSLTDQESKYLVAELGGGYGGLAYYLLRDSSNITYIDIDLPEILTLAQAFLLSSFPDKNFLFYGETESYDKLDHYDAVMLPSFAIENLPSNAFDTAFNSYSLAEMSAEAIDLYITGLSRVLKQGGTFINVNHTRNSLVSTFDFPLAKAGLEVFSKSPALWNLMRFGGNDELEVRARKV